MSIFNKFISWIAGVPEKQEEEKVAPVLQEPVKKPRTRKAPGSTGSAKTPAKKPAKPKAKAPTTRTRKPKRTV